MIKLERGITITALAITIVIMLILVGTATYSGIGTIKEANKVSFVSELEIIQSKVNTIYEKINTSVSDAEYYNSIGLSLDIIEQEKIQEVLGSSSEEGFKYYGKIELQKIGLDNISRRVLINFTTREVVSLDGLEIDGITYYKLKDIPDYNGYNNMEYINKNTETPTFSVEKTEEANGDYTFTIKDITYTSNVNGGTVSYKLHDDKNWILNGEKLSFTVKNPGLYDIKFTDKAGNSTIVTQNIEEED